MPPVSINDRVRVTISNVERNLSRGDPRNILFVVVSIKYGEYYELGSKEGTVEQHYTRS